VLNNNATRAKRNPRIIHLSRAKAANTPLIGKAALSFETDATVMPAPVEPGLSSIQKKLMEISTRSQDTGRCRPYRRRTSTMNSPPTRIEGAID
jgi:hypothetical protein